ncbi:MAG: hypothetical protein KKC42_00955 [Candidatus Omnitrophica bacterium]|nr:hypothetical protein [Candidatus Omnitrophota bacterium]
MRSRISIFGIISMFLLLPLYAVLAQEGSSGVDWKEEISSNKEAIEEQKQTIKESAQAAKAEERQLREKIRQALDSGDIESAKSLREELKALHGEHMQGKKEDLGGLQELRQELKADVKEAKKDRIDRNDDGVIDDVERNQWREHLERFDANKDGRIDDQERQHIQDTRDRREDIRDRRGDKNGGPKEMKGPGDPKKKDKAKGEVKKQNEGVRDRGKGVGAGKGKGGKQRSQKAAPQGGGGRRR